MPPQEPSPYRGLKPFSEGDGAHFHGRKALCERLRDRLASAPRFLMLIGPSGSGKTSLIRAGLWPAIQAQHAPGRAVLLQASHPSCEPLRQLFRDESLAALGLAVATSRWLESHPAVERLLLFVDHVEALCTMPDAQAAHEEFLRQLCALADVQPRVSVVVALRQECMPQIAALAPDLVPWLETRSVYLPSTLQPAETAAMVIERAAAQGIAVDPALLAAIRADVEELGGELKRGVRTGAALPLLEFALTRLFAAPSPSLAVYRELGGLRQALPRWLSAKWSTLSPVGQESARSLILELCYLGAEGTPALAQPRALQLRVASLDKTVQDAHDPRARWRALIDLELVRIHEEIAIVELSHEVLLTEWAELRGWLQEERRVRATAGSPHAATMMDAEPAAALPPDELANTLAAPGGAPPRVAKSEPVPSSVNAPPHQTARLPKLPTATWTLTAQIVVWGSVASILLVVLLGLRWFAREEARMERALKAERGAHAALLVHQPGLDRAALALAIDAVAPLNRRGQPVPPMAKEGLMIALSVARNSLTLHGHGDSVDAVAFSPSGDRVATAGVDTTARTWNARTGRPLLTLRGHTAQVRSVAFSPDGRWLLTASDDGTARTWDALTGAPLHTLKPGPPGGVVAAFSPDGQRILSGGAEGVATIWNAQSGARLLELQGIKGRILTAEFSRDGKRVLTAGHDQVVQIFDAHSGAVQLVLSGHTDQINAAQLSPSGDFVATGGHDRSVRLWNLASGEKLELLQHAASVRSVAFSEDGNYLASSDRSGAIHLWNGRTGAHLASLLGHVGTVDALQFAKDSTHLVSAGFDRTVRLWRVDADKPLAVLQGHAGAILAMAFAPDGRHVATASYDNTARLWDVSAGLPMTILSGHADKVNSVAWAKDDGTRIVTASADRTARLWQWPSSKLISIMKGHTRLIHRAVFSPRGDLIATASADETVRLWDGHTGEARGELRGHLGDVFAASFVQNGSRVVSAGKDHTLRLWDARSGALIKQVPGHSGNVLWIATAPDSRRIVTGGTEGAVLLWDEETLEQVGALVGYKSRVNMGAFLPGTAGGQLLTAGDDRTVTMWSVGSDQRIAVLQTLQTLRDRAMSVNFTRDGKRLIIVGKDRAVRLWDVQAEMPLVEMPILVDDIVDGDYAPDGSHFIVAGTDSTAKIYRDEYVASLDGMVTEACRLLRYQPELQRVREECPLSDGE